MNAGRVCRRPNAAGAQVIVLGSGSGLDRGGGARGGRGAHGRGGRGILGAASVAGEARAWRYYAGSGGGSYPQVVEGRRLLEVSSPDARRCRQNITGRATIGPASAGDTTCICPTHCRVPDSRTAGAAARELGVACTADHGGLGVCGRLSEPSLQLHCPVTCVSVWFSYRIYR